MINRAKEASALLGAMNQSESNQANDVHHHDGSETDEEDDEDELLTEEVFLST